ncbi:hypothetical protein D3C86_1998050 [compost metagenome]
MFQQNDTLIRLTVFIHRRDDHRRGIGQFGLTGLFQPAFKKHEGFSGKVRTAQAAFGVFTAQMRDLLQFIVI